LLLPMLRSMGLRFFKKNWLRSKNHPEGNAWPQADFFFYWPCFTKNA